MFLKYKNIYFDSEPITQKGGKQEILSVTAMN